MAKNDSKSSTELAHSGATKELHVKLKDKPTAELIIICCKATTKFAAKLKRELSTEL